MKIVKCFIASPSDTQLERNVCDEVFTKINNELGDLLQIRIESKRWEKDVRPAMGIDAQSVIDAQIGIDYDIFIGLMWKKFGTPTTQFGSGTEQEFENAYARFCEKNDVEIMFYFNSKSPENINEIDLVSLGKVRDFKSKLGQHGALYWEYDGPDSFKDNLERHIRKLLIEKFSEKKKIEVVNLEHAQNVSPEIKIKIEGILEDRLNTALCSFTSQPKIWVEPVISKTNELSQNANDNFSNRVSISSILEDVKSTFVKAPPQFGLTCLAHYLILEAWNKKSKFWVYLDAQRQKPHSVEKSINAEAVRFGINASDIACIVLDEWNLNETKALKLIKTICDAFPNTPLIVFQTIDDSKFGTEPEQEEIQRQFEVLHLISLPRTKVRDLVVAYNKEKNIGDENALLNKIVLDLEALNIHRTPFNCLTLLKVAEKYFDESPINRTKMLEMVLFVLFDLGEIPTYKSRPDVKDCEYVLGRFCQLLVEKGSYDFTRDEFITNIKKWCNEKLFELDVDIVFDILFDNHIIVMLGTSYIFRSSYWIAFFCAKEMHSSPTFAEYIFNNKIYVSAPEIIEFYTGIDRKRTDALKILAQDIRETYDLVESKVQLPDDMSPFKHLQWIPSAENLKSIQEEITDDVIKSGLPDEIKDQYADSGYNQNRPYQQGIRTIMHDYSLKILMQKIRACSNALRNSDYVSPDIKRDILNEILRAWEQLSKVLIAIAPILASEGFAAFEGAGFKLSKPLDENHDIHDRINQVISANPMNVVTFFKDELFSNKIGPLIYDTISNEKNSFRKHTLILFIIMQRPNGWKSQVEKYMVDQKINSFYLGDTVDTLRTQYRFGFATEMQLKEMMYLIRFGIAKHESNTKKPSQTEIKRVSNKNIPKREFDQSKIGDE